MLTDMNSAQVSPGHRHLFSFLSARTLGRFSNYIAGCVVFSFGANLFIVSNLGTDPLDVLALGIRGHLGWTVGLSQAVIAAVCLAIWAIWNRARPPLSPFFTFLFCGSLIDLWMRVKSIAAFGLTPYEFMACGVVLCGVGSALIIMSGIGIRAMDLLAITMSNRLRAPFWIFKGVLEVTLLVTGRMLGGPVGVGTLCFLLVVGWLIQPMMWCGSTVLRIPNYGLRSSTQAVEQAA